MENTPSELKKSLMELFKETILSMENQRDALIKEAYTEIEYLNLQIKRYKSKLEDIEKGEIIYHEKD